MVMNILLCEVKIILHCVDPPPNLCAIVTQYISFHCQQLA